MITPPRVPHPPSISHLQFFVLRTLLQGSRHGRSIREELSARLVTRSDRTVNQATRRLEAQGLITGTYRASMVGDYAVRERRYDITVAGRRAYEQSRAFHNMSEGTRLMKLHAFPTVTSLQFTALDVISVYPCTGKELRRRLARRGIRSSENACYRVIHGLRKAKLVNAAMVGRGPDAHPGGQFLYKLTKAGKEAVAATRGFYDEPTRLPEEADCVTANSVVLLRLPASPSTNTGFPLELHGDSVARLRNPASPSTNCGSRAVRTIPSHRAAHQRSLRETPGGSAEQGRSGSGSSRNDHDRTHEISDWMVTVVARMLTLPIANARPPFVNAQSPNENATTARASLRIPFVNEQSVEVNSNHRCEAAGLDCVLNTDVCELAATLLMYNNTDCERAITHQKSPPECLLPCSCRVVPNRTIRMRAAMHATKKSGCYLTTSKQGEHDGKVSKKRT